MINKIPITNAAQACAISGRDITRQILCHIFENNLKPQNSTG